MSDKKIKIERVQTGVWIEKRMLKVLKAIAEYHEISLGDLLEGIVIHAFQCWRTFDAESIKRIDALKKIYEIDYDTNASHNFIE